ncbi:MAG TPA: hypothetical protein VEI26_07640 [Terriglobales bacterium]|nr:hypothetical protein [Terriglobales bacterium]
MKKLLWVLLLLGTAFAVNQTAECPQGGIVSEWTHATKTTYNNGKQIQWCEYKHGPFQNGQTHAFWAECGD